MSTTGQARLLNTLASEAYTIEVEGAARSFTCRSDETILAAALRSGIGLPYECGSGGCGSCKVELRAGEFFPLFPEAPGLGARDYAKGKRLACCSSPRDDCVIRFREDPEAVPSIRPARLSARFEGRVPRTPNLWEFNFSVSGGGNFLAGQYALFHLPGLSRARAYSMSSAPGSGSWQFLIKRNPGGAASEILFDCLAEGDTVELDAPYGTACFRADERRDIVCIAGGSGLAPVLSVARAALADTRFPERTVRLFYGGREVRDMVNPAELGLDDPRLTYIPVVSDPYHIPWSGATGFVHAQVAAELTGDYAAYEYYLAGPPPMVDAVRRFLILEKSTPVHQIHYDRFF